MGAHRILQQEAATTRAKIQCFRQGVAWVVSWHLPFPALPRRPRFPSFHLPQATNVCDGESIGTVVCKTSTTPGVHLPVHHRQPPHHWSRKHSSQTRYHGRLINEVRNSVDFTPMADQQREDPETEAYCTLITSLWWENILIDGGQRTLLCDISTVNLRPLVPAASRRQVFNTIHNLSHPSANATVRLMKSRFIWHRLAKYVRKWAWACFECQHAKVHRHVKAPLTRFEPPANRFTHVHIDLVGPLLVSEGCTHLLTVIYCFTRWPEAIPLRSTDTISIAHAFAQFWIAGHGIPADITSDRGVQFTSRLWHWHVRTSRLEITPDNFIPSTGEWPSGTFPSLTKSGAHGKIDIHQLDGRTPVGLARFEDHPERRHRHIGSRDAVWHPADRAWGADHARARARPKRTTRMPMRNSRPPGAGPRHSAWHPQQNRPSESSNSGVRFYLLRHTPPPTAAPIHWPVQSAGEGTEVLQDPMRKLNRDSVHWSPETCKHRPRSTGDPGTATTKRPSPTNNHPTNYHDNIHYCRTRTAERKPRDVLAGHKKRPDHSPPRKIR